MLETNYLKWEKQNSALNLVLQNEFTLNKFLCGSGIETVKNN